MSDANPYHDSDASDGYGAHYEGEVTPRIIEELRQTRPWVRLFAILGMIGGGLAALAAVFGLLATVLGAGLGEALVMVILFIPAVIYLYPAMRLMGYASAIDATERSGSIADLEEALACQRSFWRFTGILTAIILCLYLFILLISVVGLGVGLGLPR